jgi:hypothetical protein
MASDAFQVLQLRPDVGEDEESRGTKTVFWFTDWTRSPPRRGLFKIRKRADSGEDWAEKLAAELGRLLGVPCADYDLADWNDKRGVVSWSVIPLSEHEGQFVLLGALIEGNEILSKAHPGYAPAPTPKEERKQRDHTVRRVLGVCRVVAPPSQCVVDPVLRDGADVMVGYLLFDAWTGNTDRHHRNWAWLARFGPTKEQVRLELSPSFDHGGSLGHGLGDVERVARLSGRDSRYSVDGYVAKAKSKFWADGPERKRQHPDEAFQTAAEERPAAAEFWRARLAAVRDSDVDGILARMPIERMSGPMSDFCRKLLAVNKRRLLEPR